jgi:hypothetical protein
MMPTPPTAPANLTVSFLLIAGSLFLGEEAGTIVSLSRPVVGHSGVSFLRIF